MLDDDEVKQRVEAGRKLRGLTQVQLGELFENDGLGKHDPGRIERGDLPMRKKHREGFIRHLRLPDAWFTEPDFDKVLAAASAPATAGDQLDRILEEVLTENARISDIARSRHVQHAEIVEALTQLDREVRRNGDELRQTGADLQAAVQELRQAFVDLRAEQVEQAFRILEAIGPPPGTPKRKAQGE